MKWKDNLIKSIAVLVVLVSVLFLTVLPINPHILRSVHLGAIAIIILITKPVSIFKKGKALNKVIDICLMVGVIASAVYYAIDPSALTLRARITPTGMDVVMGTIMVIVTLEVARRTVGNAVTIIAALAVLYGLYGDLIPG